ncbi:MaoC family dehydratase [Sphingobium algorifonticola]|uniref:MaoC family dehydratase n=1 Tax=Sphingobium algorifonticola TaxID=2008318 RepID=A0A437J7I6_9SPHN|nr:MaoC family dehydratase [Sphingobium algorifonticola]RVT41151.1 MaoC family dehydratase [Sphingobium algorifonticola]
MAHYFEDIEIGEVERFGHYVVERQEVIDFASKYDPQPFHLSDEAAAKTHFGKIAASGWHTAGMFMAMFVAHIQKNPERQAASLGALGVDELRWHRPCHPGDILRCEAEVIEKSVSQSRPEMGIIKSRITVFNQDNKRMMTLMPIAMWRTRPI